MKEISSDFMSLSHYSPSPLSLYWTVNFGMFCICYTKLICCCYIWYYTKLYSTIPCVAL